jgi:hypothetical protein
VLIYYYSSLLLTSPHSPSFPSLLLLSTPSLPYINFLTPFLSFSNNKLFQGHKLLTSPHSQPSFLISAPSPYPFLLLLILWSVSMTHLSCDSFYSANLLQMIRYLVVILTIHYSQFFILFLIFCFLLFLLFSLLLC